MSCVAVCSLCATLAHMYILIITWKSGCFSMNFESQSLVAFHGETLRGVVGQLLSDKFCTVQWNMKHWMPACFKWWKSESGHFTKWKTKSLTIFHSENASLAASQSVTRTLKVCSQNHMDCPFFLIDLSPDILPIGWLGSKHQLTNSFSPYQEVWRFSPFHKLN